VADDERRDLPLLREREERSQVAIEIAAREPAVGLRGEPERIGEREPDADAPEIEAQGAAAGWAHCESGGLTLSPALGMSSWGALGAAALLGESAATRSAIALSDGYFAVRKWT